MKDQYNRPLTFDLTKAQDKAIRRIRKAHRIGFTTSEFVRDAITYFDASKMPANAPRHRQVSVRLEPALRRELSRIAKQKNASVGEVLRAALDQAS